MEFLTINISNLTTVYFFKKADILGIFYAFSALVYYFLCYNLNGEDGELYHRVVYMAYFLKKNIKNGVTYFSIVNSFYDGNRGHTVHETYASFGSGKKLIESGVEDVVAYLEDEVKRLNFERKQKEAVLISEVAPFKYAGHFLIKAIIDKLQVEQIINVYDLTVDYQFKLFDVLSSLIYARIINPCSKYRTYFEVIPYLENQYSFSYDQLLTGLAYFGENYERIVEIFTKLTKENYSINTDVTYFDCTNFYFEIDLEDDFRKKGPSKENRKEPLLGMGLLLDANQIPVGLKLYPGNESEKPKLREVIENIKKSNEVSGRVVQVADKGLNCAKNIYSARKDNDGYIFSKSVKTLPEKEKVWVFLENDYADVKDANGNVIYRYKECIDEFPYSFEEDGRKISFKVKEKRVITYNPSLAKKQLFEIQKLENKANEMCASKAKKEEYGECSKYVDFIGNDGEKAQTKINHRKLEEDKKLCGYNLIVTSEIKMRAGEIYAAYHNLWRIEESFRVMKSELDARPVFLKTKNTVYGHFLICYLSVLLTRLLQIYELKDEDSYQQIFHFIREFKLTVCGNKYVNMATRTDFIEKLSELTKLPLTNAILSSSQYKKIMTYKL